MYIVCVNNVAACNNIIIMHRVPNNISLGVEFALSYNTFCCLSHDHFDEIYLHGISYLVQCSYTCIVLQVMLPMEF